MPLRMSLFTLMFVVGGNAAIAAPPSPGETLRSARIVLEELEEVPTKSIPRHLLADAEAVVIFPNTVKAGFVVGGRLGHGVAVLKEKDGWGDIRFLTLGGGSVGFQAGVQVADVVLVFKTRKGLDRILDGKAKLTLGADAAVAAGPLGRDAAMATDGKLKAEIWSYSRARGFFAGVSLDGVVLTADKETNETYTGDSGEKTRMAADALKKKISMIVAEKLPVTEPGKSALPPATIPPASPMPLPSPAVPPATVPTNPADLPPAYTPGATPPPLSSDAATSGPIVTPAKQPFFKRLLGKK